MFKRTNSLVSGMEVQELCGGGSSLHEGVGLQLVLDLLRLERRRELQGEQRLRQAVAVWRRRALVAGRLHHLAPVEEVLALLDEGLDDRLVELGGGERVLVLEVRPHQRRPEADGEVVGRHQGGLTVLAYPIKVNTHIHTQTFNLVTHEPLQKHLV